MAGKVSVREVKGLSTMTTTRLHLFTRACHLDNTALPTNYSFWNVMGFTMRSGEEHFMLEKHADGSSPLMIGQYVIKIRLIPQNMEMMVGPRTPLHLMFNLGCLEVAQVPWTGRLPSQAPIPMLKSGIPPCSPPRRGQC